MSLTIIFFKTNKFLQWYEKQLHNADYPKKLFLDALSGADFPPNVITVVKGKMGESLLENWYNDNLCDKTPEQAQNLLIETLKASGVSEENISKIEKAFLKK